MADNTKGLASTSQTPLHEQLRRFVENVRAHPGEIESSEYSITTPISWDGLGYAMHPLAAFEEMADALEAAAALRAPTIAADDAVCGWCALEECKECLLRRKDHAGVTTHAYEPEHDYVCAGCPGDVLWNSDNYTEHPGHDHDFDPIPFATPSPTIEIADAYRDARLQALRDFATELERRLANVIALSENVLRGQVWPHSGNSFAQAMADAARGKKEATPSPTPETPFITCDDCGAKITDMRDIETTEDRCWHKNCPKGKP